MKRPCGAYRYSRLQVLEGNDNDPYRPGGKPAEPAQCGDCGAVLSKGRWRWGAAPAGATKLRCPACRRSAESMPAGFITLTGGFFARRRDEVIARARHCEAQEAARHPLERILKIENDASGSIVTTTSTHLARRIAHALKQSFKGEVTSRYGHGDNIVRMRWHRD